MNTAFIWAVAFKHERNGGVADCFRTESGELCNQAWVLAQTPLATWGFLQLRERRHSGMERGQVRWCFCDTGNQRRERCRRRSQAWWFTGTARLFSWLLNLQLFFPPDL